MDCFNSHHRQDNQPLEQPQNLVSFVPPMNQSSLGGHMNEQQVNRSLLWTCLENNRLELDQILQAQNEQIRVALQQKMYLQNGTLLNLAESMARGALIQKNEMIAHLQLELQRTQEALQATLQDRDDWMYLALGTYELNALLLSQHPTQGTHANGASNELESTGSCNQALNMEDIAAEGTHRSLICKVCCARDACMLILPCQHLCACEACGRNLTVCPICNSAKVDAIQARFG